MPGVRVVSLKVETPQSIPADGQYHLLKFPYDTESYDPWEMHNPLQPDAYRVPASSWQTQPRSGLVWPCWPDGVPGWGTVHGLVYWEAGDYTEVRSRIVRDPLGLAGAADSTCTEDHAATPGGQFRAKTWGLFVDPQVPLGLMVRHNASTAKSVTLAELKLVIHPVEEPPA
ncbi:conserved hypothetical protein [Streptomyces scabiei 87.22]|uniref:Uncharacterized protein n=1 Tax=Streptomyces scabiei (strain 87.22) TaxID=680198 RepID=C9ZDT7_STRSW|nr:hypothetical protein [Streptomyces scabiei]MDX2892511.1 hypothetical protein [Streptomyces scabiei]MDX2900604.1 hypothetical protein [Streptomyces scabiei]MDX2994136.1 hypothetical protein [Streptomyces scabiei]MDX3084778.1 hypothetical protein [Streptomyces scabiei]MDX3137906.1 hypothetical protein [Streptomyces scabiei]